MGGWTYSKAGVDLSRHVGLHKVALETALRVNSRVGLKFGGLGGFSSWVEIGNTKIALHIDGVGTKSLVACKLGKYEVIGWDAVIVNVNDVVCGGFRPISLVSYIAMSEPNEEIYRGVFKGIEEASIANNIAILGGETALLPGLLNGVDVACALLGIREFDAGFTAHKNDVVVGLRSNGIHANGYSLVRKVIESTVGYEASVDGVRLSEELVKPVANYGPLVLEAFRNNLISAAAHITGGAFRKVKRIISNKLDIVINAPKPPKIFEVIMNLGNISPKEMYSVFNMGIGMVLTLREDHLGEFRLLANKHGIEALELGYVSDGKGNVLINTPYGDLIEF